MKTLALVFIAGLFSISTFAVTDLADLTGQSLKPDCPRTRDSAVRGEDDILRREVISVESSDESTVAGEQIKG